jgi:hypothetical protein
MTHVDPETAVRVVLRARLRAKAQSQARAVVVQRHYEEYRTLYAQALERLQQEAGQQQD